MRDLKYISILIAVSAFLFFFKLGDLALTDPDEPFYAETAREMLLEGEWITPKLFGEPQFEKPILYYWLIKLSYIVFGVGEFAARFPSALFGLLGVLGIYLAGRMLFSPLTGFLSGIMAATSAEYLVLSRGCVTDMVLTVLILFCLVFFIKAWMSGNRDHYVLSAAAAALAVLTKGPIGLFIPGMAALIFMIATRSIKRMREIPFFRCIFVFAAIAFPWYIIVSFLHGQRFYDEFFGFHNIVRFVHPEHKIGATPLFYIPVLIGGAAPWSVFLPFAAWRMWKDGRESSSLKGYRSLLLAWFLVVFVFFTASQTRLVTYIFPLFPVLYLILGWYWEKAIVSGSTDPDGRFTKGMYWGHILLALSAMGGLIGGYIALRHRYSEAFPGMLAGITIFSAALAVSLVFLGKRQVMRSFAVLAAGLIVGLLPVLYLVIPVVEKVESSKIICDEFLRISSPGDPIGGEDDNRRGVAFYTGRTDILDIHPQEALMEFVSRPERVWCIMKVKHFERFKKDGVYIVPPPVFQSGKKMLVTNKPLGDGKRP
ncbi:MAG: glycosyltransferase family 39 protein [Candidatus Omnitrophica bacterium]|jgi:4-amino-4-deoxy-L-arabinose transferase-like glycosyltransferase|nr:glycosyltransferase family 39 protein [Candidatus Omnitrophota bacterium]